MSESESVGCTATTGRVILVITGMFLPVRCLYAAAGVAPPVAALVLSECSSNGQAAPARRRAASCPHDEWQAGSSGRAALTYVSSQVRHPDRPSPGARVPPLAPYGLPLRSSRPSAQEPGYGDAPLAQHSRPGITWTATSRTSGDVLASPAAVSDASATPPSGRSAGHLLPPSIPAEGPSNFGASITSLTEGHRGVSPDATNAISSSQATDASFEPVSRGPPGVACALIWCAPVECNWCAPESSGSTDSGGDRSPWRTPRRPLSAWVLVANNP